MKSLSSLTRIFLSRIFIPMLSLIFLIAGPHAFAAQPLLLSKNKVVLQQTPSPDTSYEKGRYMAFFSLGLLPGSMDIIQTTPLSLGMSHGYYYHGVFVGGGMAVENFQPAFLPVYADMRFFLFPQKPIHPWVKIMLGKNFLFPGTSASSDQGYKNTGDAVAGIGSGISYQLNTHAAFFFYLGYRYMKYTEKRTNNMQNPIVNTYTFNRMEFRIGFNF